jgi:hypothetical protein
MRRLFRRLVVPGVFLAVMIVGFGVMRRRSTAADERGPGEIRAVVLVGDALVLSESVHHRDDPDYDTHRLTLLGVADGKVRARTIVGKDRKMACGPSIPGRIWCVTDKSVELRDASTLAVVADHAKIVAALGAEPVDHSRYIHPDSGEILLQTGDRRDTWIDATMKTRPYDKKPDGSIVLDHARPRSTPKPESGGVFAALVGSPPVLVGTDTRSLREVWRYDGSIAK